MLPVSTPDCNFTLGAPIGLENEVIPLPCRKHNTGFTSYWKPSPNEYSILQQGGLIAFTSHSAGHPVISLTAMPESRVPVAPASTEQALDHHGINHLICGVMFFMMGLDPTCPDLTPLEGVSLAEMLSATAKCEEENKACPTDTEGKRTITTVADDRVVAAAYAFLHYRLRPQDPKQETVFFDGNQALVIVKAEQPEP
jgi:hypothetical protein